MLEMKMFTWKALADRAPGTALAIRARICGLSVGHTQPTCEPDLRTPHHSRPTWNTPAATTPAEAQTEATMGSFCGKTRRQHDDVEQDRGECPRPTNRPWGFEHAGQVGVEMAMHGR